MKLSLEPIGFGVDPTKAEARLIADELLDRQDFTGCTTSDVANGFSLLDKRVNWDAPPPELVDDDTRFLDLLRARRDLLLLATDQTQIREDFSTEDRESWSAYRAALRAWPDAESDLQNPTEPGPPDAGMLASMVSIIERLQAL
jgi:hypothetical protein